jgi:hypothetical protein
MNPDTPENRMYVQRNRLWLLGEVLVKRLVEEKPDDPIAAALQVLGAEKDAATESIDPPTPEVAAQSREYLQTHKIASMVEEWLKETLEAKPENPIDFSIGYFKKVAEASKEEAAAEQALQNAL